MNPGSTSGECISDEERITDKNEAIELEEHPNLLWKRSSSEEATNGTNSDEIMWVKEAGLHCAPMPCAARYVCAISHVCAQP